MSDTEKNKNSSKKKSQHQMSIIAYHHLKLNPYVPTKEEFLIFHP